VVLRVNWEDNPWFPPDLEAERAHMARTDPDAYAHVWGGECRSHSDAQVLNKKWVIDVFDPVPGWQGPYLGADWGFAKDPTVLVKCWIESVGDRSTLYVEHEAYGVEVPLDDTPAMFERVPGAREHVIRADCARPETINHIVGKGWPNLTAAPKWPGSVEDGIEFLRSFERIVIHERCRHAAEEARLWSFKTDRLTGDVLPALVDSNNHVWDAVRYALSPMIRRRQGALWLEDQAPLATDPVQRLREMMAQAVPDGVCGSCSAYTDGQCTERGFRVGENDPGCGMWDRR
jgi:phage terminase large subunit